MKRGSLVLLSLRHLGLNILDLIHSRSHRGREASVTPAALSDSGAIDVQELSMLEKAFLWPQARLIAFGTALLDEGGEEAAIHSRCLVAALRGAWCEHACLIQSVSKFSRCPLPSNEIV